MSCREKEYVQQPDMNGKQYSMFVGVLHLTILGLFSRRLAAPASAHRGTHIRSSQIVKSRLKFYNVIYIYIIFLIRQTLRESRRDWENCKASTKNIFYKIKPLFLKYIFFLSNRTLARPNIPQPSWSLIDHSRAPAEFEKWPKT